MTSISWHTLHPPTHPPVTIDWPPCPTPIQIPALAHFLRYHPDQEFVRFILQGLSDGFHIGFSCQGGGLRSTSKNPPSSLANPGVITSYIQDEIVAGQIVGPLAIQVHEWVHCSPIGLVPKSRGTGQWRMIVDLSYPASRSVNDEIASDPCLLKYSSVDNALQFITKLGQNTVLIKVDLKSAYHSTDCHLFGIHWDGKVYVDQALPFGLCSAPKLFTAVADAIGWALVQAGIQFFVHYLDDLLFFVSPSGPGLLVLSRVSDILESLGVPVAVPKIEGPATVVTFLGILVGTS